MQVITKSDDREAVQFVNHEYDYRQTSDDTKSTYQLITRNNKTFNEITVLESRESDLNSLTTLKIIS